MNQKTSQSGARNFPSPWTATAAKPVVARAGTAMRGEI